VSSAVPPTINSDDASSNNISVVSGKSVVIACPATGVPPPLVTWFKDDVQVVPDDSSDVRVLSNGRRLEISGVEVDHAGRYRCLAKNTAGHVEREYQLHVLGLFSRNVDNFLSGIPQVAMILRDDSQFIQSNVVLKLVQFRFAIKFPFVHCNVDYLFDV